MLGGMLEAMCFAFCVVGVPNWNAPETLVAVGLVSLNASAATVEGVACVWGITTREVAELRDRLAKDGRNDEFYISND